MVGSLGLLAVWWGVRSVIDGSGTDFLPLGASIIAFAAAFASRSSVTDGVPATRPHWLWRGWGPFAALAGFVGLVWRWFPLAMPAQGLWRLSSSLTYADAAGLVFGICLLLALGSTRAPAVVRVVVCLNLAGLLATQSRGALLAVACGCFLVPARRFGALAVPLVAGLALGVAAIASSPDNHPAPWLAAVFVTALTLAGVPWRRRSSASARPCSSRRRLRLCRGCCGCRHRRCAPGAARNRPPGPGSERSGPARPNGASGLHQWLSAPLSGVGPDRLLDLHAADGSSAHFVHDEYLQIAADTGLVGVGLMGLVGLSLRKNVPPVRPAVVMRRGRRSLLGRGRPL